VHIIRWGHARRKEKTYTGVKTIYYAMVFWRGEKLMKKTTTSRRREQERVQTKSKNVTGERRSNVPRKGTPEPRRPVSETERERPRVSHVSRTRRIQSGRDCPLTGPNIGVKSEEVGRTSKTRRPRDKRRE